MFQYVDGFPIVSVDVFFNDAANSLSLKANLFYNERVKCNWYFSPKQIRVIFSAKRLNKVIKQSMNGGSVNQNTSFRSFGIIFNSSLIFPNRREKALKNW